MVNWIDSIKPGEKWSVAISGTGIINHIWFTISPMNIMRNNLVFRIIGMVNHILL